MPFGRCTTRWRTKCGDGSELRINAWFLAAAAGGLTPLLPAVPDPIRNRSVLVAYMRQLLETLDEDDSGTSAASPAAAAAAQSSDLRSPAQLPGASRLPAPMGMMGFLEKQGGASSSSGRLGTIFAPFQRRWFVLDESGVLRYYHQPEDMSGEARGELSLTAGGVHVSREAGTTVVSLIFSARELRLRAATEDEADRWAERFRAVAPPYPSSASRVDPQGEIARRLTHALEVFSRWFRIGRSSLLYHCETSAIRTHARDSSPAKSEPSPQCGIRSHTEIALQDQNRPHTLWEI